MGRPPSITREALLEKAREVFAKKGFAGATLADIAGELNVTAAAILRYAPSKEELFRDAMRVSARDLPQFLTELPKRDPRDPERVLRELAEQLVPFLQKKIEEQIALFIHSRAATRIRVSPLPRGEEAAPAKAIGIIDSYMKKAIAAKSITFSDSRAAAMLFLGSLHAYVLYNHVLRVTPRPFPLNRYLESVFELWQTAPMKRKRSRNTGGVHGRKTTR